MNFWKTFIITLVLYLGLNTVFTFVAFFTVSGFPTTDIWYIVVSIFGPIGTNPYSAWVDNGIAQLLVTTDLVTDLMVFLGFIVPPLVSIIVAAFIGDNQFTGFGAWFLTAFLSCCLYAVFIGLGQANSAILYLVWLDLTATYGNVGAIIGIIFAGVVNGFFYGSISSVITKKWI